MFSAHRPWPALLVVAMMAAPACAMGSPNYRTAPNRRIVDDRSALMMYRLFLPLRAGGVFVAVGALHLHGAKGMLAQLKAQGYKLRRVY